MIGAADAADELEAFVVAARMAAEAAERDVQALKANPYATVERARMMSIGTVRSMLFAVTVTLQSIRAETGTRH